MEQIINAIEELFTNGTIPSMTAILMGIVSMVLTIAKNKLVKLLSDRTSEIAKLETEIVDLHNNINSIIELVTNEDNVNKNTNQIVSAIVDMLHVAYTNSKLGVDSKINLQKLYDKCPDALCDAANLFIQTINEEATEEQVQIIEDATPESYADIIAEKIAQEV